MRAHNLTIGAQIIWSLERKYYFCDISRFFKEFTFCRFLKRLVFFYHSSRIAPVIGIKDTFFIVAMLEKNGSILAHHDNSCNICHSY